MNIISTKYELIENTKPLEIINNCIVPALDKIGQDFESKKEQPLKNSIGFMVFTGIIGVLLIRVFIVSKNKK